MTSGQKLKMGKSMNDFFLRTSSSSTEEVFKKSETLKKDSKDEMSIPSSSQNSFKKPVPAGLLSKKRWKKLKSHYIPSGTNTKQIISSEEDSEDLSKREIEIISHYDEPQGDPSQNGQTNYEMIT